MSVVSKCKTNTLTIFMHQMRITTNQVSSVVPTTEAEKVGNLGGKIVKTIRAEKTKYCAMKLSQIRRRIKDNPSH
jgi:hypothetical protein